MYRFISRFAGMYYLWGNHGKRRCQCCGCQKSLHRSLAEHSKREGISMNQYCLYLLARNDAVYSK